MTARIRKMRQSDWPAVSAIYREGIEFNIATFERECPPYETWDRGHLTNCRYVAAEGGEVVGWIALSPVSARDAYRGVAEISLYIAGNRRSGGLGEKLARHLIKQSERQGIWSLLAVIVADNAVSIALAQKAGFRLIGRREKIARDNAGAWRDTVMLERRSHMIV